MSDYEFNYSQYTKKLNIKNNNFSIIFLVIILLLGCCVYLKPLDLKNNKLYFIQAQEFQTYNDAKNLSQEIKKNGFAGYIYFDKNYHVLISFHTSKADAKTTLKNSKSKHKNISIFYLEKKGFFNGKNLNKTQIKAITNFKNKTEKISLELENYYSSFFDNSLDLKTLSIHIENIKNNFDKTHTKLIKSFDNNSKFNPAKKHANNMLKSLSNLCLNVNELTPSSAQYEIINFVINQYQFLSCF